jgi:hypothetical protein
LALTIRAALLDAGCLRTPDVILRLAVDASPELLAAWLPVRWALAHRLDESRQKAQRRDERRRIRSLRAN